MFGDIFPIETLTGAIYNRIKKNGGELRKKQDGTIEVRGAHQIEWCSLQDAIVSMLAEEVWTHKTNEDESKKYAATTGVIEMAKAIRKSLGMEET